GIVAGPLRHGPAFQRVAHLQAEIVVATAGVVQLHNKNRAPAFGCHPARRLARLVEAPFAAVVKQAHTGFQRRHRAFCTLAGRGAPGPRAHPRRGDRVQWQGGRPAEGCGSRAWLLLTGSADRCMDGDTQSTPSLSWPGRGSAMTM